jgi:hypothetical protein
MAINCIAFYSLFDIINLEFLESEMVVCVN